MKRVISLLLSVLLMYSGTSQQTEIDSLKSVLNKATDLYKKFHLTRKISFLYPTMGQLDSGNIYINKLFNIATELKDDSLLARCYMQLAGFLDYKTDSKDEISYLLKALKIAEQKYPSLLSEIFTGLGSAYSDLKNYDMALIYLRKAEATAAEKSRASYLNFLFAISYYHLEKLDSALHYINVCNEILIKHPESQMHKAVTGYTGFIYTKLGNDKLAESYFLNCLQQPDSLNSYYDAQAAEGYSKLLLKQDKLQLAKYYALKGLGAAKYSQAKVPFLNNVQTLRKIYESLHQPDSAYYYATLELNYRDSLFNQDKVNAIQDMTFNEQIRQKEETIRQFEEAVQHKRNLQYAAIAIAIITFVIFFLLLSRSIVVKTKFIEFFGVLGLLAVFEFINLFIHPYLSHATNNSPVLMLVVLIAIGALLIPLHHKLEKWITKRMVEKNKKIRLAAAKKTIEKLGG